MLRRRILLVTGALALSVPTTLAHADGVDRFDDSPTKAAVESAVRPQSARPDATVEVMVELTGDPVAAVQGRAGAALPSRRVAQIRAGLKKSQAALTAELRSRGGTVHSQMQSAFNGMRVSLPRRQLNAVSQLAGVKSVSAVPRHTISNSVSVPFLGVPQVWQSSKYRGEGVKVAVIDTGIDYTHAAFNGPGTVEAFEAAKASDAFTPTARVKGGYDFVGDAYDGENTPRPDANPLDCNGHGSHVAGTAGGGGVNADGTPFTGPYDANTSSRTFKVAPGVAPMVDLYALKVFGCDGSSEVVTEAIDWAVAHDMDVINMSLGSDYGTTTDSTAIAAQNAHAAGVIVVAAAGNNGPNPYLVGSPSTGRGVISVAAVDSTASYPGARLSFAGTTMPAVNANGATLPAGPYEIVHVADDPATGENESLGCSAAAFTAAGVSSAAGAPLQVAVVQRGQCARVAKAIYGQQAGADAVIMVNNAATYPPYEGPITENPDTTPPTPVTVTIPFLGVRSTDHAALRTADGQTLTLAAAPLPNPGFKGYASFSSGGPRTGDSGLRPAVSAPGVSIASVGVGTGTEAAVLSGTSMATPHVAGVAALARQAHKNWTSSQLSAALVNTADPANVSGYRLTLGGGLVDAKQSVGTTIFAYGDRYNTAAGRVSEGTLSFGFTEPSSSYTGVKEVTLVNKGGSRVLFSLSNVRTGQSRPATVNFSRKVVVVPARSSRTVRVTLKVKAGTIGSSLSDDDQWNLHEVSGTIKIGTNGKGTLRVPYLLVPRAAAKVTAPAALPSSLRVTLTNPKGARAATADFYTWGLSDARDVNPALGRGFDLRAAGVQSFADGDDQLLVFAVNSWTRWSNAANHEFDVSIDVDRDGDVDFIVFSYDSGAMHNDSADGLTEVFVYDVAKDSLSTVEYLPTAPTDSSTILLPVHAGDLGITGAFDYSVSSFGQFNSEGSDDIAQVATYDPSAPALSNGQYVTVGVNGTTRVPLALDREQAAVQRPLGTMIVVFDNKSGSAEALLRRLP